MRKEEILKISKKTGIDEREEMIETNSSNWGLITVLAMVVIFGIWNLVHGIKSYELVSIFTGYLATTSFYKYKKLGEKRFLIGGIIGAVATIAGIIAFFLGA